MEFDLLEFIGARAELLVALFALGAATLGTVYAVVRRAVRDAIAEARRPASQDGPCAPLPADRP